MGSYALQIDGTLYQLDLCLFSRRFGLVQGNAFVLSTMARNILAITRYISQMYHTLRVGILLAMPLQSDGFSVKTKQNCRKRAYADLHVELSSLL